MTDFSVLGERSLKLLSVNGVEEVDSNSLTVLEKVGVNVRNNEAMVLLRDAGCEVDSDKNIARIPRDLVKECLRKTVSVLKLYGREGKHEQTIGLNELLFNPGSSAVYFSDHSTGQIRRASAKDLIDLVRLVDALEYINAQSTAVVPSEVPKDVSDLYRLYLVLENSTKGIITGAFTKQGLVDMKHLLEIVAGGESELASKPMAIFDVCPSSPLVWSDTACQNLIDCAKSNMPAEIVPAPQIGATSPITLAGTLMQSNAEFLSGMVISQLTNSGAPIIYGGSPTTFDMKHLSSRLGSIENIMVACAAAQMGKYYRLPTHAYLGLSDSKMVDAQAGIEACAGILLGGLAGVNVISGPGMLVFENCQSLEKLLIDNEICGMVLRLIEGIRADDDTYAVEVIGRVGPGGHYLGEKHTVEWLRKEQFFPSDIIDRLTFGTESKQGSMEMMDRARKSVDQILKQHAPEPLAADVEAELERALKKICGRYGVNSLPNF